MKSLLAFLILLLEVSGLAFGSPANSKADLLATRLPVVQVDNYDGHISPSGALHLQIETSLLQYANISNWSYVDAGLVNTLENSNLDIPATGVSPSGAVSITVDDASYNNFASEMNSSSSLTIEDAAATGNPGTFYLTGGNDDGPYGSLPGNATCTVGTSGTSISVTVNLTLNDCHSSIPQFNLSGPNLTSVTLALNYTEYNDPGYAYDEWVDVTNSPITSVSLSMTLTNESSGPVSWFLDLNGLALTTASEESILSVVTTAGATTDVGVLDISGGTSAPLDSGDSSAADSLAGDGITVYHN